MHILLQQVIFYIFSAIAVISALMVITQDNPVRCVLFLVLTFFASSVLWLLVQAEFLALVLVIVYVGAVMTLFLFVVMMLNIDTEVKNTHVWRYLPLGLLMLAALIGLMLKALTPAHFMTPEGTVSTLSNTEALGMVLYTQYVWAFELAAVVLLVAIIAAITLVHRKPQQCKQQNVVKQIMTNPKDRVTLHVLNDEKG